MGARSIYDLSGGRFGPFGLGAGGIGFMQRGHGIPLDKPLARARETVAIVRGLLTQKKFSYDGQWFKPNDFHLREGPIGVSAPPIWLAGLGPRTAHVAAELADGWLPTFLLPDRLCTWRAELDQVRALAGERTQPLTVAAGPLCMVDADPETARRTVASLITWYLCAMGEVYPRIVAAQGYAAEVQAIQAANPRPRPFDGVVPAEAESVLKAFTVWGSPCEVHSGLADWDTAADVVMLGLPAGLPWESLEKTLRAAAPAAQEL
jgi:alkanesulfonate monooxygenase SsuD/methylene tetrahydromethanopterin reductase-like flavin-dependent oxidoreductase (luciferase family)